MTPADRLSGAGEGQGKTVVVGVKMDAQSLELLTWSLVKEAQPGDRVVALHVLPRNEIVDRDGKSTLLSLVKEFDSVLGVYEGFCDLKQVDLKLKICRGPSIRKILVRESISYAASKLIVGTSSKHHMIRTSSSVAKYCARKLPKDCAVLAIRNGKVVFQSQALPYVAKRANDSKCWAIDNRQTSITNSKLKDGDVNTITKVGYDQGQGRAKIVLRKSCTTRDHDFISFNSDRPCTHIREEQGVNSNDDNAMALVPLQKLEVPSSLISLLVKELPEFRPGWPLLRHALSSARKDSSASFSTQRNRDEQEDNNGASDFSCHNGEELRSLRRKLEGLLEKYSSTCRIFKYQELQLATSNFMPDNLIGKGGSSQVYWGSFPDSKKLAVKVLKPSEDILQEFVMEIDIITSLHHKNIISLFGFCFEDNNLLLVYDLLPRGSLEDNLHGSKKDPVVFRWDKRYKVAMGVAEALNYLHNHSIQSVIHGDVKSSNILLSEDFEPQLSDFGLAKRTSTSSHITCSDVVGTFGYLAPEYFMYGRVTDKIDVYAFGVVLLELLSGRKPISSEHPKGQESLVMWANPILDGGKISKLLDPTMSRNYNCDQIERMVLAATLCIRREPRTRPQMTLILKLLKGDADVMRWARSQVNASEYRDTLDKDGLRRPDLRSHLNLALLDVEDDSMSSVSSIEQHFSLEEYFRLRWSRSSSFD